MGKLFFNILTTFAEFEADLIRMRTREGMAIARTREKLRGKQPKLSDRQQRELCRRHATGEYSISDLAETSLLRLKTNRLSHSQPVPFPLAYDPAPSTPGIDPYLRQRAMLVEYASQHVQHMQKALTQMNVKLQHVISDITGKTGMAIVEAIVNGDIRRLRSYLRQRAMLVEYASHHIQHMQKALTQMNVKLQHVIRDITGKTGMDIIEAIAGGERDPRKLARLRDPRTKADEATITKSLQGHWREEHIFELSQALELYRAYHVKIAECDREIEVRLEQFEDRSDGEPPAPNGKKRNQGNAPRFDVQGQLYRMTGVDLTRIDGVDGFTALKVVSEVGTDMTKWESAKHFASWLGLSPNNRITGGRVMSSKTKPSANRAAAALRLAANALHRSNSALGAFLRRKKAHLGAPKAITATAHKLARLIYSMLRYGQEYVDAGAEYYEHQYQQRALSAAKRRAAQLGYQLVPMSDGEHQDPGRPLNPAAV